MPTQPITAMELRIGNLVLFAGLVNEISVVSKQSVQFETGGGNVFELQHLSSIPLTPEWLERFGFRYKNPGAGGQDSWAGYGYWALSGNNDFNLIGTKSGTVYFQRCWDWHIKSVHQLQNLYFALTGSELIFKP